MRNIKDLRVELCGIFDDLKKGDITKGKAKELNNGAGKIISSCKVELEYNKLVKKDKRIDFLEYED